MRRTVLMILIPLALSACANQGLRDLRTNSKGPDEFMISPAGPLQEPASYSTLPPPTPGQANLTDRSALSEGVTAFGGNPQALQGGIDARDGALVNHANRKGVTPGIRTILAEADADFRRRKGRLTQIRIVPVDRYEQAYRRQALDASAEAARWRRAGARTPSSPPRDTRFNPS
ncbi:hypothetical protein FIU94_06925 [Sulfitobacter sp. THAF37]|uniref:DUF3035 domain-containing protein n=1 Tax=Sulfitobacter sp. THAF37 TaxID=2587855 RepID=UPI001268082F|nr:DUF3035 domain-containing protein [Sulfitobacter sp. THAF37]QFT58559.1 hypothetical protein FIU94_06925 [Sulfitobacter sp. THAF37]